jgi:short subunit dehydrogenase-like uncharacterized protein
MCMTRWMIYGANGYTGQLLTAEAVRRGHQPLLAGRSAGKLKPLADAHNLDYLTFPLDSNTGDLLKRNEVNLVLHAAGPFLYTAGPMREACLAAGAHYLDITGEVPVFEATFALDSAAKQKNVALISGVGFDIVPTDCLIAYLATKLEQPHHLEVAVDALGFSSSGESGASVGTLKTALEMIQAGIVRRRNGKLEQRRLGQDVSHFRFPQGQRMAILIPWGDVSTAYRAVGVPNIDCYMTFPPAIADGVKLFGGLAETLVSSATLRRLLGSMIERSITGPSERLRQTARSMLYARMRNQRGETAEAWLETLEGYQFTLIAGIRAVERVLAGGIAGALTPSQAFGADFVLEMEPTFRHDTLPS